MHRRKPAKPRSDAAGYVMTAVIALLLVSGMVGLVWWMSHPQPPTVGTHSGWRCERLVEGEMCQRDPGPVLRH
jgi:hypothetical protein